MVNRVLPVVLASLALLGPLAIHLFFPLIPVLKSAFELTNAQAQLAFSAGILSMAFSTLAYGSLADRYGRRPVLLVGLALFLFGSAVSAFAASFSVLLMGRIVSSMLMKEALHRPAVEFGLYFSMVPLGFVTGSIISSRIGNRASVERMILIASSIAAAAAATQSTLLLSGRLTPLVLFIPGTFITLGQGLSLPFAQAGAMATVPRLAGTAAGIGVFTQNFFGAGFAQLYGLLADGTALPMVEIMTATVGLGFLAAAVPSLLKSTKPVAQSTAP